MTESGLEWLHRLFSEPKRLWKRYLIGGPLFLWLIIKQKLKLRSLLSVRLLKSFRDL
jgi:N-acetylglucosaminyldiphosphoundecaprenol N-acetyl-beta-D-mannosaminyltransferase